MPEVSQLLRYLPNLNQQMFFAVLWVTEARLFEALALTPAALNLEGDMAFAVLKTPKQRSRGKGGPRKDEALRRAVLLTDPPFIRKMQKFLAITKKNKHELIWPVYENTVRNWLCAALERTKRDDVAFSVPVITPHTFRLSYCMNLIQHGIPLKIVQAYACHATLESTEVYTKVFVLDIGRKFDVRFTPDYEV